MTDKNLTDFLIFQFVLYTVHVPYSRFETHYYNKSCFTYLKTKSLKMLSKRQKNLTIYF